MARRVMGAAARSRALLALRAWPEALFASPQTSSHRALTGTASSTIPAQALDHGRATSTEKISSCGLLRRLVTSENAPSSLRLMTSRAGGGGYPAGPSPARPLPSQDPASKVGERVAPSGLAGVPLLPLTLGLAGALPFIATAPPLPILLPLPALVAANPAAAQAAYGACILSFLGAPHWGLAMAGAPLGQGARASSAGASAAGAEAVVTRLAALSAPAASAFRYAWGVTPSLLSWLALVQPPLEQRLLVLIPSFVLALGVDLAATRAGLLPAWYPALRVVLTTVAVLSMSATVMSLTVTTAKADAPAAEGGLSTGGAGPSIGDGASFPTGGGGGPSPLGKEPAPAPASADAPFAAAAANDAPAAPKKKKVVVVGGGFGGAAVAKLLEEVADVTLIDSKVYFEITWATLRALVEPEIAQKIFFDHSSYLKRASVVVGTASGVTETGVTVGDQTYPYDFLVLATGSMPPSSSSGPAPTQQERIDSIKAEHEKLKAANNILIVGGGPVGVELAGEIVTDFPDKRVTLVHGGPRLLEFVGERAGAKALQWLQAKGVTVMLDDRIGGVAADQWGGSGSFKTASGKVIETDYLAVATGSRANAAWLGEAFSGAMEGGCLKVDPSLRVKGHENVFAVGNVADLTPKQGFLATIQGNLTGNNIKMLLEAEAKGTPVEGLRLKEYPAPMDMAIVSLGRKDGLAHTPLGTFTGWLPTNFKSKGLFIAKVRKDLDVAA